MDEKDTQIKSLLFDIGRIIHFGSERRKTQLEVLRLINDNESLNLKDIENEMNIKGSSASEIVSKLERRCYITRQHSSLDRRKIVLEITKKGKEFLLSAENTRQDTVFSFLNEEEKEILIKTLKKILSSWKEEK